MTSGEVLESETVDDPTYAQRLLDLVQPETAPSEVPSDLRKLMAFWWLYTPEGLPVLLAPKRYEEDLHGEDGHWDGRVTTRFPEPILPILFDPFLSDEERRARLDSARSRCEICLIVNHPCFGKVRVHRSRIGVRVKENKLRQMICDCEKCSRECKYRVREANWRDGGSSVAPAHRGNKTRSSPGVDPSRREMIVGRPSG